MLFSSTAQILTASLLLAFAATTDAAATKSNPLLGVDPNTLSCDPRGQIFLLLPHYTDCGKFFTCDNGREVEMLCPAPLIFDFVLQTCNWDWATKCWLRTSEEDLEGSGSGDGEELEWAWNEPAAVQAAVVSAVRPTPVVEEKTKFSITLDCTKVDSAVKMMAYKHDCQRYWRCTDGVPQTAYCTDGLFFNEAKQQCDFEANVKCDQKEELGDEFIVFK